MTDLLRSMLIVAVIGAFAVIANAQKGIAPGDVCGDPTAACKYKDNYEVNSLPFNPGKNWTLIHSKWFYAVILASKKLPHWGDCSDPTYPEEQRLKIQEEFPHNKVFTQNCVESASTYYEPMPERTMMIGIYAGSTLTAARAFLKKVQATGNYPGVKIRRMRAAINGT